MRADDVGARIRLNYIGEHTEFWGKIVAPETFVDGPECVIECSDDGRVCPAAMESPRPLAAPASRTTRETCESASPRRPTQRGANSARNLQCDGARIASAPGQGMAR